MRSTHDTRGIQKPTYEIEATFPVPKNATWTKNKKNNAIRRSSALGRYPATVASFPVVVAPLVPSGSPVGLFGREGEGRMATSTSTHTTNSAEYETKNNPSTLIESITKQGENARKYERIFGCGVWCLTGYTNGNSEADTVESKGSRHGGRVVQ